MKMKNEEEKMKIFFTRPRILTYVYLEYLNIADSISVLRFFISFLDQKLQPFEVKTAKRAKKGQNGQVRVPFFTSTSPT